MIWRIYTPLGPPRERANGDISISLRPTEDVECEDGDEAIDYARQKYGPGVVVRGMVPREEGDAAGPMEVFEILKLTDGGWQRVATISAPSEVEAQRAAGQLWPKDVVSVQAAR